MLQQKQKMVFFVNITRQQNDVINGVIEPREGRRITRSIWDKICAKRVNKSFKLTVFNSFQLYNRRRGDESFQGMKF